MGAERPAGAPLCAIGAGAVSRIPWPPGTAPRWQNTRLGQASFVVELPPGRLSPRAVRRYAAAVLDLARDPSER